MTVLVYSAGRQKLSEEQYVLNPTDFTTVVNTIGGITGFPFPTGFSQNVCSSLDVLKHFYPPTDHQPLSLVEQRALWD